MVSCTFEGSSDPPLQRNSSGQLAELIVYIIPPELICIVTKSYWSGCCRGDAGVKWYFDPHDILTPVSKYRCDILTTFTLIWPHLVYDEVSSAFYIYLISCICIFYHINIICNTLNLSLPTPIPTGPAVKISYNPTTNTDGQTQAYISW